MRYLPVFDYERTDATIETEKLLQNGQNFRAAMVFRAFRQVILQLFSREDLILFFKETNFDATDSDTQRRVLSYILQNTDIDANVVWSDYILLSQNLPPILQQ